MTMTEASTIPTLTTADDARTLLEELAADNDWVSVFWDRGWGDSGQAAEISIIVDGDGQNPRAFLTKETYRELVDRKAIQPNSYGGYKARRVHDYKYVPPAKSAAVLAAEAARAVAESLCRELLGSVADVPLAAEFGYPNTERLGNALAGPKGFVLMIPTDRDIIVSPNNGFLGNLPASPGKPGGAIGVPYPEDSAAILGAEYRAQLDAVIREQHGHILAAEGVAG
jgi:hypothetical protein